VIHLQKEETEKTDFPGFIFKVAE